MTNAKLTVSFFVCLFAGVLSVGSACGFDVSWDGQTLPVSPARVSAFPINQVWPGYQRPVEQTALSSFVSFDMSGPGELRIIPDALEDAGEVQILPLSFRPQTRREGRDLVVKVERPRQFTVSFGRDSTPLHVFANPPFAEPKATGSVRRFGPGEHHVGVLNVKSGETVVVEEGAVVYGAIHVMRAKDVRIVGRGIVDGTYLDRASHETAAHRSALAAGLPKGFYGSEMAVTTFTCAWSTNVLVEGVTFRDPPRWTMIVRAQSKNVTIDNVKIIGCWRYNSDGINACASEDVTIRNCFLRTYDDCIIARGAYLDCGEGPTRNILAENCVLWCDWGKNLEVWAGHKPCLIENVTYRNIACIYPGATACDVTTWFASPDTRIRNVTMEDIELDYARTRWTYQGQKSREQATYGGTTNETSNILQVDVVRYGHYLGNQRHKPATDLSGFRVRYENLVFRNFRAYGDVPELSANVQATTAPHTIDGLQIEGLPKDLKLEVTGKITNRADGKVDGTYVPNMKRLTTEDRRCEPYSFWNASRRQRPLLYVLAISQRRPWVPRTMPLLKKKSSFGS